MTTGKEINFRIDNEYIEVVNSFCLLGSVTNTKETSSQEI